MVEINHFKHIPVTGRGGQEGHKHNNKAANVTNIPSELKLISELN